MDDTQKPPPETQQSPKESPVKKPLSIKILQVLFLVWGLSSSTSIFGAIIGIPEIMVAWGLFRYTKQSLSMARLYVIALLVISSGASLLLTLGFLSRLINSSIEGSTGGAYLLFFPNFSLILDIILAIFIVNTVILIFTLHKIRKILKTNIPDEETQAISHDEKTKLSSFLKSRRILYISFIFMFILLSNAAVTYFNNYQTAQRNEYGTPVTANSPQIISESHTSPDKAYTVKEFPRPAVQQIGFGMYDKNGNYLRTVTYDSKVEVPDGVYRIQEEHYDYTVSFKGWINNHTFVVRTLKEDGTEYEDIIDIKKLL